MVWSIYAVGVAAVEDAKMSDPVGNLELLCTHCHKPLEDQGSVVCAECLERLKTED